MKKPSRVCGIRDTLSSCVVSLGTADNPWGLVYYIPPFVPGSSHYDIYEVFPNPAKNLINIHSRDEPVYKVEIYNITGRKVLERCLENRISLQSLKSGIYFIRINDRIVRQFVIE